MKTVTRKFKVSHKQHGKIELELEIPQAETHDESVNWAGGEAKSLDVMNWSAEFRAKSGIRSAAANATETETLEQALAKYEKIAGEAMPSAGRIGPTKQDKLSFADAIAERKASGEEVTGEALLALAMEFGIA